MMDIKALTDELLAANITVQDMADACGVSRNTILRARMDPSNPNARTPQPEWEPKLRALAKQRGTKLVQIARASRS